MNANNDIGGRLRRSLLWLAIVAGIGSGPAPALAQDEEDDEDAQAAQALADLTEVRSEIEIGICSASDDSFRFGRYNGLEDQGLSAIVNLDLMRRGAYDGSSAAYWSVQARDLGLDTRSAHVEFGEQGNYRVRLDYDQIPVRRNDDVRTIYQGAGSDTLTLPTGWVGAQNTAGMTQLLPSLQGFALESERRRVGLGLDGQLGPNWSITSDFRHESKDGIRSLGAVFGNSGGNPRAALIPEPIEYSTDQISVAARYFNRKWQFQLAYDVSLFNDHDRAVSFQNAYTAINGWTAATGYPNGVGQMSTPPDNAFHQMSFDGGYNFSDATRLSASYASGRMTQDEAFLPYTAIPALAAAVTTPLPRRSLDGRIDTTVATVKLSSRAWEPFHWNASYRYDDRDNRTPRDRYVYIGGDSQVQATAAASDRIRYNEPYSYTDTQYKVEAGYRFGHRTELSASAERRETDRTLSERERADEDTVRVSLRTEFTDWFSGNVRWSRANRDGSTYNGAEPLESGFAPEYVATLPGGFENPPALRKFHEANRTRDIASAFVTVTPIATLSLSAGVEYALDDYDESALGLTLARIRSHSVEAVYAPAQDWSVYGWFTHEDMDANQNGQSIGGATRVADSTNPARSWFAFHRDTLDAGGVGLKHTFPDRHLEIGADYVRTHTDSDIGFRVGSALSTVPLPSAKTTLDSVGLNGSWDVRRDLTLKLRYWYEKYDSSDWQVDSLVPNQLANVITLGETSPQYKVHEVFASMTYRF